MFVCTYVCLYMLLHHVKDIWPTYLSKESMCVCVSSSVYLILSRERELPLLEKKRAAIDDDETRTPSFFEASHPPPTPFPPYTREPKRETPFYMFFLSFPPLRIFFCVAFLSLLSHVSSDISLSYRG